MCQVRRKGQNWWLRYTTIVVAGERSRRCLDLRGVGGGNVGRYYLLSFVGVVSFEGDAGIWIAGAVGNTILLKVSKRT